MKGQEVQEVLFFPPQPLRWATVLCTGLSRAFSRPSRAARLHCLPRSLQTKQGKGLGLYVGRKLPPLATTSLLLPSFLQGWKWKIRVAGQVAPRKPKKGLKRKKTSKTEDIAPLGASGE